MSFSQANILEIFPPVRIGTTLKLSWSTSSTPGTVLSQVYVDKVLSWFGPGTSCYIAVPTEGSYIDIGEVGLGEGPVDFSSSLPAQPKRRAYLDWPGGSYLDLDGDMAGFHVYQSPKAGAAIDYTKVIADIPAYVSDFTTDGYGLGPYNGGGWGLSESEYEWTSGILTSGTWYFGVKAYDTAGNESTALETSVNVCVPPKEVPPFESDNLRLHYTYNQSLFEVTLLWQPTSD